MTCHWRSLAGSPTSSTGHLSATDVTSADRWLFRWRVNKQSLLTVNRTHGLHVSEIRNVWYPALPAVTEDSPRVSIMVTPAWPAVTTMLHTPSCCRCALICAVNRHRLQEMVITINCVEGNKDHHNTTAFTRKFILHITASKSGILLL